MTNIGDPVWVDFGSTAMAASKAFYEGLFGWRFVDTGEEMAHYNMVYAGDDLLGGAMDVSGMTCPAGDPLPSAWGVFLKVDDIEARFAKALEAGATEVMAPADAGGAGRHAIVLDPSGASIAMWQAGDIDGFTISERPGSSGWFELMTKNYDACVAFYETVFDLKLVPMGPSGGGTSFRYATNGEAEDATFGVCEANDVLPAEIDSHWRVYFTVESCDPAIERIKVLGGSLLDGPRDSPFGRVATVADPAGASFEVIAPSEASTQER